MFYYEITSYNNKEGSFTQPFYTEKYLEKEEEVLNEAIKQSAITEEERNNYVEVVDVDEESFLITYAIRQESE